VDARWCHRHPRWSFLAAIDSQRACPSTENGVKHAHVSLVAPFGDYFRRQSAMEIDPAAPRLPLAGSGRACVRSRAARQIRIRRDDGLVAEGATTLPRDIELRKSRFAPIARVIGGFDPADRNPMDSRHTGALCNCSRKGRPIKPKQLPKVIAGNSRETFTSYRETDAIGRARSMREREREREMPGISSVDSNMGNRCLRAAFRSFTCIPPSRRWLRMPG
jgi:hypothetical protein